MASAALLELHAFNEIWEMFETIFRVYQVGEKSWRENSFQARIFVMVSKVIEKKIIEENEPKKDVVVSYLSDKSFQFSVSIPQQIIDSIFFPFILTDSRLPATIPADAGIGRSFESNQRINRDTFCKRKKPSLNYWKIIPCC